MTLDRAVVVSSPVFGLRAGGLEKKTFEIFENILGLLIYRFCV